MRTFVFILLLFISVSPKDYCGPGTLTIVTPPDVNECCRLHDEAYGRIPESERLLNPALKKPADDEFCICLERLNKPDFMGLCFIVRAFG